MQAEAVKATRRRTVWNVLRRNLSLTAGCLILLCVVFTALFPGLIASQSPTDQNLTAMLAAPSAQHIWGTDELGRTDGPAIEQAPFYAGRVVAVSPDTAGGVTVNTRLQVVDVFGEPIPGLYAVGNMVGGFKGRVNVGCGQAIGWGYTSGRLAAEDILANA